MDPVHSYNTFLSHRQNKSLRRYLPPITKQTAINYTHTDYMQLTHHPVLAHACIQALEEWGVSGGSSRVLQEDIPLYTHLETLLAETLHMQNALTFVSGYQANATVVSALLDQRVLQKKPLVCADRFIHASLHHGIQRANLVPTRYQHQDLDHLERLLVAPHPGPKFVITESIFSMAGTQTDITALAHICARHGAFLFLDEAHALGVCGAQGYGLGPGIVNPEQSILMGTFTKGVGAGGAYVAGPHQVMDYLTNTCTGLIYTTAPSPLLMAAALASWKLLPHLEKERAHIQKLSKKLFGGIQSLGFKTAPAPSHIIPLILGDNRLTLEAKARLSREGIGVSAIRPPTVPGGTARLRFGIHAGLSEQDIDTTLMALEHHVRPLLISQEAL